ncbi:TonB-dependent receptor plug domain-containing protein [Methylomusa anaerophila]|uniref:Colicin I receptor n=1 Tax=Methylomusa anaerophila TaxID=1930071 RepID=A0A348AEB2_9FIRM|nr:TonB-dependent receptor [Methylomusa anaerophila]BBB89410.1 colicin I receptor precursor [Methylomusa anaerophila]
MKTSHKKGWVLALTTGIILSSLGVAYGEEVEEDAPGFQLDQVVVTATRTEKKIKDVPVVVEVITKEDLEKKNVQNLDDALKGISGIMIKRNTGLSSSEPTVIMRGFKFKGILVLVDGQSQNDGYNGQITWSQIPIENIERIEVVKGPGSSLFGSGAQAGVINIITKSKAANETVVKLGSGTQGTGKVTFGHSGSVGKLDYYFDYSKIDSDGFITAYPDDKTNYRGHQSGGQEHYSGKLIYRWDKDSKLSVNSYRGNSSYKYELGTDQADKVSKGLNLDYQRKVNDKVDYQITWGEKKTDNWYYSGWSGTVQTQNLMHQLNYFETTDGDMHVNWQVDRKNLLTLGYSLRSEQGTAYDERELRRFYPEHTWSFVKPEDQIDRKSGGKTRSDSFYFQDEHKFNDKFTTFIGGRYVRWETTGGWNSFRRTSASPPVFSQYGDREESNFSGRIGMVYKANEKATWKFNVGQGFRTPSFYELYRSSQTTTTDITTSNINLKPEKSTSYDLMLICKINHP